MKFIKTLFFLTLLLTIIIYPQKDETRKIAILPFISSGLNSSDVFTSESILRMEAAKQNNLSVVTEKRTLEALNNETCSDEECAKEIGNKLNTDEVLICKLNPLGEKIIIQYILVETSSGKNILSEQTTALNVEDLEAVMKRIAISIARKTPFNENQEVGNIVGKESIESLRRAARYNFGVGFGYLFPDNGYDSDKKSFTLNAYFDYELDDYSVGLMLGGRKGFAINLYGNYLLSKKDICPYFGGALGFHWIASHSEPGYTTNYYSGTISNNKDEDGIELGLEAGIRLLHTYNFQLFIKGEYILTFNDYNDRAFVFTIGIL